MWILFLLLMTGIASANVYVLTDSNNAVVGLSEQNDIVAPKGDTITEIKGKIPDLPISGDPTLYNFNGNTFTLNTTKVQAQQASQQSAIASQTSQEQAKASAIAKLTDAISKVNPADVLTSDELKSLVPGS